MNTKLALALITSVAFSTLNSAVPMFAESHAEKSADDAAAARHARHEAHKQRAKAEHDAAKGDVAGAERHEAEANADAHAAHHDAHEAHKQAEKAEH